MRNPEATEAFCPDRSQHDSVSSEIDLVSGDGHEDLAQYHSLISPLEDLSPPPSYLSTSVVHAEPSCKVKASPTLIPGGSSAAKSESESSRRRIEEILNTKSDRKTEQGRQEYRILIDELYRLSILYPNVYDEVCQSRGLGQSKTR